MNLLPKSSAAIVRTLLLFALGGMVAAVSSVQAQQQIPMPASTPSMAASKLVVLDPAHGGSDTGAVLGDKVLEKDVTLALASRLRSALAASGFTVASTRESDVADILTSDSRAEVANRSHALACVVLHATAYGSGVHIFTSSLQTSTAGDGDGGASGFSPVQWETAQAGFVLQSRGLAAAAATEIGKHHISTLSAQAPLRPLDNLMCPAIAIELAPLIANGGITPVTEAAYQQQVVTAVVQALVWWRDQGRNASKPADLDSQIAAQSKAIATAEAAGRSAARARAANAVTPQKGKQ
ncbi:MAG TPA: N-acetylmuramoyl-L-alanine amidase [Acidobacteriaceae bacterium]|nr:N-acetylmuramoyl-L-alanine amidase [Acidobacteriaceae bacterium]